MYLYIFLRTRVRSDKSTYKDGPILVHYSETTCLTLSQYTNVVVTLFPPHPMPLNEDPHHHNLGTEYFTSSFTAAVPLTHQIFVVTSSVSFFHRLPRAIHST